MRVCGERERGGYSTVALDVGITFLHCVHLGAGAKIRLVPVMHVISWGFPVLVSGLQRLESEILVSIESVFAVSEFPFIVQVTAAMVLTSSDSTDMFHNNTRDIMSGNQHTLGELNTGSVLRCGVFMRSESFSFRCDSVYRVVWCKKGVYIHQSDLHRRTTSSICVTLRTGQLRALAMAHFSHSLCFLLINYCHTIVT